MQSGFYEGLHCVGEICVLQLGGGGGGGGGGSLLEVPVWVERGSYRDKCQCCCVFLVRPAREGDQFARDRADTEVQVWVHD